MKFGVSAWGGCGMINVYLNFDLLDFWYIHLFLFMHNHCERTNGPIDMKFGLSGWNQCGLAIT